jgi:hypothetical protein
MILSEPWDGKMAISLLNQHFNFSHFPDMFKTAWSGVKLGPGPQKVGCWKVI